MPQARFALLLAMVLVATTAVAVHFPALSARALSIDDTQFLTENELIQNPGWNSIRRFFSEVLEPTTVGGYYLPLSMISLMTDYALGGRPDDPTVFHRTSLALHAVNAALVVLLLWMVFGSLPAAAAAGLLFGAHPLTVEPIIWVGERKTLLATFFALTALIAYARHARRGGRLFLAGSVLAYALSLLSKPTATPLPLLLVLLDFWPFRRFGRKAWLEKIPFAAVGAASAAITLISHGRSAELDLPPDPSPVQVLLMASRNVVFYLRKIVWPGELTSYYHVPEPLRWSDPAVAAGVIGTLVLALLVLGCLRWTRAPLVGIAFFVLALAPTLGFVRYSWVLVSDKYVYFPAVGLLLLLASLLDKFFRRWPSPGTQASVLLVGLGIVGLEARAVRQYQTTWRDSETLFRHMADTAAEAPRAHDMLGNVLLELGRTAEAEAAYRRAVALDSTYASAWSNLGNVRFMRGNLPGAMDLWRRAVAADPRSADALANLGTGLAHQGNAEAAINTFRAVLRRKPRHPYALNNLGIEVFRLGKLDEARDLFARAVREKTNYADARVNLGIALARLGRAWEALTQFEAATRYGADPRKVEGPRAGALVQVGRFPEAAAAFEAAIRHDPRDARLRNNHALVLARLGRREDATAEALAAVALDSTYADARLNAGFLLEQTGDREGARAQYRAILRFEPDHAGARERLERTGD